MKNIILIIIASVFSQVLLAQGYKNVSSAEFNRLIKSERGILIDVRTSGEYSRGHIEGSNLIDVSKPDAGNKIGAIPRDANIYLYCLTGSRSKAIANSMVQAGFKNIYNLQYGIVEWNRLNLPLVQSNTVVASKSKTHTLTTFNKVIQSNKVVLVDFYAPWCAPCKKMSPDIDKLKTTYSGKAHIEKVDIDINKTLKSTYKIQSIPGLVIFQNGKEVWRHSGAMGYDELSMVLKKYL